jgi:hypothetical protein
MARFLRLTLIHFAIMLDIQESLKKISATRVSTVVLLLLVALAGFYLRYDNLSTWSNSKSFYFTSSGLPITLDADPYYYLDIAKDLLSGRIKAFDEMRNFPTGGVRTSAAPLLSVLLAAIAFLTDQPLEWVAVLIPPFLGVLLAVPVYFLAVALVSDAAIPFGGGRRVSLNEAKFTGALAALFALLSPPLVVRSSIGWCDTDILNVTWAVLCLWLAGEFYAAQNRRTANRYFLAWFLAFLGFAWWWDQAVAPVVLLAGAPMFMAVLLVINRFTKKQILYAIPIAVIVLSLLAWQGGWWAKVQSMYAYVFGSDSGGTVFPAFEGLVDEQGDRNFMRIAKSIGGNPYLFIGSLAGLLPLSLLARKKFLFLLPLLALSALSFKGMRFMIFAAPLFGLGVAALLLIGLVLLRSLKSSRFVVVFGLTLFLVQSPIAVSQLYDSGRPVLSPRVYDGMQAIAANTPDDSVIWSSWGHGHPLVYFAGRRTIGDGMFHSAMLDFVSKFPFATNNLRLSANWIQFYATNGPQGLAKAFQTLTGDPQNWAEGVNGLKKLLAAGVAGSREMLIKDYGLAPQAAESFLTFLFPVTAPPIYVFMDYKLVSENWYEMGKWNLAAKTGPKNNYTLIPIDYYIANSYSVQGDTILGGFSTDLQNGIFNLNGGMKKLAAISIDQGGVIDWLRYPDRGRMHFMYLSRDKKKVLMTGLIADLQVKDTVLVKLFFEKQPSPYFEEQKLSDPPAYMLCKVNGEKYSVASAL